MDSDVEMIDYSDIEMIDDASPDTYSDIGTDISLDISLCVSQEAELFWSSYSDEDLDLGNLDNRIHPIFSYKNFTNISDNDYNKLLPSLRLASLLLTEPCLLTFWHDLFFSTINEDDEYLKTTRPLAMVEMQRTNLALLLTSGNIKFRPMEGAETQANAIGATESSPHAEEIWHLSWHSWSGTSSEITYLESHFSEAPGDTSATRLQKRFRRAVLLLHEVAHAATFLVRGGAEPYYGDAAVAEAGFEWEAFAFGGAVRDFCGAPGSALTLLVGWPNVCCGMDMAARGAAVPRTVVAWKVPVAFVQRLFARAFWAAEVKEAGRAAFHPECRVGWAWDGELDRPVDFREGLELWPGDIGSFLPVDCQMDVAGNVRKRAVSTGSDSSQEEEVSEETPVSGAGSPMEGKNEVEQIQRRRKLRRIQKRPFQTRWNRPFGRARSSAGCSKVNKLWRM